MKIELPGALKDAARLLRTTGQGKRIDDLITSMNRAAEQLTGWTLDEVLERDCPLHDIVHHTYPDGRPFPLAECAIDRWRATDGRPQRQVGRQQPRDVWGL